MKMPTLDSKKLLIRTVIDTSQQQMRGDLFCLNNFYRGLSEAQRVHKCAELATTAVGACYVPVDEADNSLISLFKFVEPPWMCRQIRSVN